MHGVGHLSVFPFDQRGCALGVRKREVVERGIGRKRGMLGKGRLLLWSPHMKCDLGQQ